jgi:hypothetical protein
MEVQKHICTLEQAIKLKELGVEQDSLFYYYQEVTPNNSNLPYYGWKQNKMPFLITFGKRSTISTYTIFVEYSAFTASELGKILFKYAYVGLNTEAENRANVLINNGNYIFV